MHLPSTPASSARLRRCLVPGILIGSLLFVEAPIVWAAAATSALLDDFSDPKRNQHGTDRFLVDDKGIGSQSQATQKCEKGILVVEGELVPGRGVPAFISLVSPMTTDGNHATLLATKACVSA